MTSIDDTTIDEAAAERLEARAWWVIRSAMTKLFRLRPIIPRSLAAEIRSACTDDNVFHVAFLVNATALTSPALFMQYVQWATRVLATRNVPPADLKANLECLHEAVSGVLPRPLAAPVLRIIEAGQMALDAAPLPESDEPIGLDALEGRARTYLQLVLAGNRDDAVKLILSSYRRGLSLTAIYEDVLAPAQREIGRLWEVNRITVAEEHRCTAIAQLAVGQLHLRVLSLRNQYRNGRSLIAASVGGDLHDLGLRMIVDLLEAEGWTVIYLGAAVPQAGIVRMVAAQQPDLLLLSVSLGMHLRSARDIIRAIRAAPTTRNTPILVGGHAFSADPELWGKIQATVYAANAEQTLEFVRTPPR